MINNFSRAIFDRRRSDNEDIDYEISEDRVYK